MALICLNLKHVVEVSLIWTLTRIESWHPFLPLSSPFGASDYANLASSSLHVNYSAVSDIEDLC